MKVILNRIMCTKLDIYIFIHCRSLMVCLSVSFWPLYYLSFDLRLLITIVLSVVRFTTSDLPFLYIKTFLAITLALLRIRLFNK